MLSSRLTCWQGVVTARTTASTDITLEQGVQLFLETGSRAWRSGSFKAFLRAFECDLAGCLPTRWTRDPTRHRSSRSALRARLPVEAGLRRAPEGRAHDLVERDVEQGRARFGHGRVDRVRRRRNDGRWRVVLHAARPRTTWRRRLMLLRLHGRGQLGGPIMMHTVRGRTERSACKRIGHMTPAHRFNRW